LNPQKEYDYISGKCNLKLGGAFNIVNFLDQYLIKIVVTPQREVMFYISCADEDEKLASFVLNTMVFIFQNGLQS
jgi:hypothetical protein